MGLLDCVRRFRNQYFEARFPAFYKAKNIVKSFSWEIVIKGLVTSGFCSEKSERGRGGGI